MRLHELHNLVVADAAAPDRSESPGGLRADVRRWSETGLKAGSVTLAGDELLLLTERGLLLRAPATPEGFKPTARTQVLPSDVRAFPALAGGFIFARGKDRLVCLNLSDGQ